jgi:hypothetical protein
LVPSAPVIRGLLPGAQGECMALSSIPQALSQFNANAAWYGSIAAAQLRLEAVEFLLTQRAQDLADQGSSLRRESLEPMAVELRRFLGAGPARAFGRSRELTAGFSGSGGVD